VATNENDQILERMRGLPAQTMSQLEAMMDPSSWVQRWEANDNMRDDKQSLRDAMQALENDDRFPKDVRDEAIGALRKVIEEADRRPVYIKTEDAADLMKELATAPECDPVARVLSKLIALLGGVKLK